MNESTSILGGIFSPHGEFNIGASMLSPDDCPLAPMTGSSAACLTAINTTTPANNNSNNNSHDENHHLNATTQNHHNDHKTPVLSSLLKSSGDDDNGQQPSETVQTSSTSLSSLLSSQLRNKKRPREDSVSSFDGKPLYRVVAGKRYPLHSYAIRLIEQVVNQGNKSVLDRTPPNEAENERKMRMHLSHRYSAVADENHHVSLIDFTHKLMQLWGGRLELLRNEFSSTAVASTASTIKAENSTRRISFKPSPPPSAAAVASATTTLRSQSTSLNSRVSPLIRRTSPHNMASGLSSTSPALHRFDDLEEDDLMSGLDFLDDAATFGDTLSSAVKSTTKPPPAAAAASLSSSSWPKRKKDPSRRVTYHGDEATLPQLGGGKENHHFGVTLTSCGGGLYGGEGGVKPPPLASYSNNEQHVDDPEPTNVTSNTIIPTTPATGLKRGVRWDASERKLFLNGLEKFGAGNWKEIHKLIPGRTYVQVKSMGVYLVSKFHMSRGQGPSKAVTDYLIGTKQGKQQL